MPIPVDRGRNDYDWKVVSDENSVDTGSESMVQQSFKEEVDINTIVRRYGITQSLPFGPDGGMYGDFTGIVDYEAAVALIEDTQRRFMALPAEAREKFKNDPQRLIEFAQASTQEEFDAVFRPAGEPAPVTPAA